MAFFLIVLAAALYTAANYLEELYFLNWFSFLPFLYYNFKIQAGKEFDYKKYFLSGQLFGFFILLFSANFIYHSIKLYTAADFWLIIILLLLLFFLLSLIYGFFFLAYIFLEQKINSELKFNPYRFAAFWLLLEFSRHYLLSFFPVGNSAYTQAEFLHFIQLADYGGIWTLTFILVLFNGLLYQLIFEKKLKNIFIISLILIIIFSVGNYSLKREFNLQSNKEEIKIGIIRTQISQEEKWSNKQLQKNINILLDSAAFLNESRLIIAPETNITFDFHADQYYRERLLEQVAEKFETPVQIGSLAGKDSAEGRYNSSFLISDAGETLARYDKNLLLYFGETYPYLELLNEYTPYNFSSLNAGTNSNLFKLKNLKWKTIICSEI